MRPRGHLAWIALVASACGDGGATSAATASGGTTPSDPVASSAEPVAAPPSAEPAVTEAEPIADGVAPDPEPPTEPALEAEPVADGAIPDPMPPSDPALDAEPEGDEAMPEPALEEAPSLAPLPTAEPMEAEPTLGSGGATAEGSTAGSGGTAEEPTSGGASGANSKALSFEVDIWPVYAAERDPVFVYPGGTTYAGCAVGGVCHGGERPGAQFSMADAATALEMLLNVPSVSSLCEGTLRVVPGEPDQSCLILFYEGRLRDELDWVGQDEIDLMREWIAQGAAP